MPARRSTRRGRTQASDIEDAPPARSQPASDVDENDSDAPPPPPRKSTAGKKSAKVVVTTATAKRGKRKVEPGDEDAVPSDGGEADDAEAAGVDVENFRDQPLERDRAVDTKLTGLSADWQQIVSRLRTKNGASAFTVITGAGEAMEEYAEGDDARATVKQLDGIMRELIDACYEFEAHKSTLDDIRQRLNQNEKIEDVIHLYEKGVKEQVNEYRHKTSRQKYGKDERYTQFQQRIWDVRHGGEAMPPVTSFIDMEDGDDEDEDDIVIGGRTQDYRCPLTLMPLEDPVTSRICDHSYSRAAIMEFLASSNRTHHCPAAGCKSPLTVNDLDANEDLARRVKVFKRRQQRAEEEQGDEAMDDDDDDVVE